MLNADRRPRLFIFDMGGVVAMDVICVPAMAAEVGLTEEEFFRAAGGGANDSRNSDDPPSAARAGGGTRDHQNAVKIQRAAHAGDASPLLVNGGGPWLSCGAVGLSPYARGDLGAIQAGDIDEAEFWRRFTDRAAELFPDRYRPFAGQGGAERWGAHFRPRLDPGTVAIIEELRSLGNRVVCGTNTLPAHFRVHTALGQYSPFDAVYASFRMGCIKPFSEFWRRILEAESRLPADAFFIDDNAENVAAADGLGIRSHLFHDAGALRRELSAMGSLRS